MFLNFILQLHHFCSISSPILVTFNWLVWEVSFFMRASFFCLDFHLYIWKGLGGWANTKFRFCLLDFTDIMSLSLSLPISHQMETMHLRDNWCFLNWCRLRITHLLPKRNASHGYCSIIFVSTYLLWFYHIQFSDSWGCEVHFHCRPGIFRFFVY